MEYFCAAKCASSIPDLLLEREKAHNEALEKENEPPKIVFFWRKYFDELQRAQSFNETSDRNLLSEGIAEQNIVLSHCVFMILEK